MAEQVVDGGFVRGLELQVGVLDVPRQQAFAFQVSAHPLADRVDQPFQDLGLRGRQAAKYRWFAVGEIHSVQKQHVKVNIQIQGAAESLDQGYSPGLGGGAGTPGLVDEMGLDGPVDDTQYPAHDLGSACEQEPELEGKAQDPLAHRQAGQDLVDQQGGAFDHSPGPATGAKTASLAAEGH